MAVDRQVLQTQRGDQVVVTLFRDAGAASTVLVSVDDVDGCTVPTVELTMQEVATLRETLRQLSELGAQHRGVRAS